MSSSKAGDEFAHALAAALRYTRAGVRSTQEVLNYLHRRGVAPRLARRVIGEARARGVLDDHACARLWAEHWARRGYAWSAIRLRLCAKGLDEDAIEQAANQQERASDDDARARLVVARQRRHGAGPRQRSRLARTLTARGFDTDLIQQVLDESFSPE